MTMWQGLVGGLASMIFAGIVHHQRAEWRGGLDLEGWKAERAAELVDEMR